MNLTIASRSQEICYPTPKTPVGPTLLTLGGSTMLRTQQNTRQILLCSSWDSGTPPLIPQTLLAPPPHGKSSSPTLSTPSVPVTEQRQGVVHDKLLQKGFPLSVSGGSSPSTPHLLGSKCPPPAERLLSMSETGEKEGNGLFKSYTDLE